MTATAEKGTAHDLSLDCIHCGLCLPACPTYEATASEADSPRGRILLMRAYAEGRLLPTDLQVLRPPIDRCLDCRACESACPSGVQYGGLLEQFRAETLPKGRAVRWALDLLLAHRPTHHFVMASTRILQTTGVLWLLGKLSLPRKLRQALELAPAIPPAAQRAPIPPGVYEPDGPVRAEVGLFTGCLMETVFGRVNRALLRVLLHNGVRVHVPAEQGCCGALHLHAGLRAAMRPLIATNVAAFPEHLDAIVVDSAGCGSAMKEYGKSFPDAERFSARVKDMSEFLAGLGLVAPPRPIVSKVAWDDPCHLCHGQGVRSQPRELLAAIAGLRFAEVQRPEDCCGSAGIYNLLHPELAYAILERKLDDLLADRPDRIVTGNPGCMLQLELGLRRRGRTVPVQHIAEVLAEAYERPDSTGARGLAINRS